MTAMTSKWLYSSKLFQALNFFTKDDLLTKVISSNQSSISQNVGPHCSQILLTIEPILSPTDPAPRDETSFSASQTHSTKGRGNFCGMIVSPNYPETHDEAEPSSYYQRLQLIYHIRCRTFHPPPATLNNDITTYSSHPHNLLQHDDIRQHDVKCLFTWNRDHEKSREIGHFCYHEFTWFSFVIPWSVQLLNKVLFWDILVLKITEINTNPCQIYPLLSSSMQWVVGNQ